MSAHGPVDQRVWDEQDDVLGTLPLVRGDKVLEDRLFHQLVDLLVEGMFVDLREQHLAGAMDRREYVRQLGELADLARSAGLLPLSGHGV